jgi:hypothetical protein
LGILITRGRLMSKNFQLNDRAKMWINGIRNLFVGRPLESGATVPGPVLQPGAFKIY